MLQRLHGQARSVEVQIAEQGSSRSLKSDAVSTDLRDDSVFNSDGPMEILLARRGPNILTLVTGSRRAEGHAPLSSLTKVVMPWIGIVPGIALRPGNGAPRAVDLRVRVRRPMFKREPH